MKVALVAITDRGFATAKRLSEGIPVTTEREIYLHKKALDENVQNETIFERLSDVMPMLWHEYSVLIFVMATGIVVRQIASFIDRKDRDPAILVLDEEGKFIIPLLSGHLGGANAWATYLAEQIGASAVITTASDVRGMVAPDEYARRYGWKVEPINHLPSVNRLLLEQGFLKVWSSYMVNADCEWLNDKHYHFLSESERKEANVILDAFLEPTISDDCIYLVPPILSIGVGCRRGVSKEAVLAEIITGLEQIGSTVKAVAGIYSIDLKADEIGIIEAAKFLGVPFQTFSAEKIQSVNELQQLSQSDYVLEKIGVSGVCEAASLLGTQKGRLILPKISCQGVTVAISMENSLSWALGQETPLI